jgi:putative ABC transport system ATP-binding protein
MTDTTMTARPVTRSIAAQMVDAVKVFGRGPTMVRALDGVTVEFEKAQFAAIMGPSGSGKSTLLHCIAGLDQLTEGQVLIDGVELRGLKDKAMTVLRRERIGFVFQSFNLVPTLTARENIVLPLALAGRKVDEEWLSQLVDRLGIADRLAHRPAELSGGQQQRVAMGRALATHPALVFADEPTGNLDSKSARELLGQMRTAVDDYGQAVVMVTHDVTAASFADRVLFLADGKIVNEITKPTTDSVLDAVRELGS